MMLNNIMMFNMMFDMLAQKAKQTQTKAQAKGQGVIEYAGALVIAAVLVSTVLAVGPTGLATLFNSIITAVQGFITTHLSTLK